MDWKEWIGKRIFLRTKQNKVYSGVVKEIENNKETNFLSLIDKFNDYVTIAISEIIEIKEENGDDN